MDADNSTLVRRYSDSRRLHPLSTKDLSLEAAIEEESKHLEPLIQQANLIIDTGSLSTHELAERLREFLRGHSDTELKIVVESFGFKYGIPLDADYVFVMDDGHVVMQGMPRDIFSQVDTLLEYGLDVPQITRLAWELKQEGLPLPDGILSRQELVEAICQLKSKT